MNGRIKGRKIVFRYKWNNGGAWGCGCFRVSKDRTQLVGYYLNKLYVDDVEDPKFERMAEPWEFTRTDEQIDSDLPLDGHDSLDDSNANWP